MSREVHAGFCERRGVRLPPATHLIIGAGAGGLTAAANLALLGRHVVGCDRQPQPSSNMSTFTRGDCQFDIGLHYVGGRPDAQPAIRAFLEPLRIRREHDRRAAPPGPQGDQDPRALPRRAGRHQAHLPRDHQGRRQVAAPSRLDSARAALKIHFGGRFPG